MSDGLAIDLMIPSAGFVVEIAWQTKETAIGLFGPSGAGKSSVLEALVGIRRGVRGRIEVGGKTWLDSARGVSLPPEARGIGYVAQDLALFPHRDVLAHLRFGERRARRSSRRLEPERVLALLELGPLAHRPVTALSGGERQRVALGRALCSAPEWLLLDEPLAGLDLALRRRILPYLLRIREEFAIPTLHVSHESSEMTLLCREVCELEAGKVVSRGAPGAVLGAHRLARGEAGAGLVNVFAGTVEAVGDSLARIAIEPGVSVAVADEGSFAPGQRAAFELRATDILLARAPVSGLSAQNVLPARVGEVLLPREEENHAGAVVQVFLGRDERPVSVVVSRRACRELELAPGSPVTLIFKAQACRHLATY